MKYIESGLYVGYKDEIRYLSNIKDVTGEIPYGFYIRCEIGEKMDETCIERFGGTEYAHYIRPVKSYEIEWMYEIKHFLIFQGKKYNGYWVFPDEGIVELSIYEKDRNSYDSKYDVIMVARGEWILKVPIDEVTLYETKTYLDKDKYINEDIEEVLSEETYLIDEPWWFEETKDN
ncbi:hypothetical protein [uncultured Eubacterium sp.]|uniref:hypothetical protein n=1 Tax=uncultured Eubacterium sp. TaxID=165185 RepID=UPI002596E71C|nr:hypothetical protein [uncultured Eubacterium sp.]